MIPVYGKRFIFLDRTRYDIGSRLTVLGCTLWTNVPPRARREVEARMTDFRRIRDWDMGQHMAEHQEDLDWLNDQVQEIELEEPERQIAILTYVLPCLKSLSDAFWMTKAKQAP